MQGTGQYSQYARRAMMQARQCAQEQQHAAVDTSHLLVGVLRAEGSLGQRILAALGLKRDTAEHAVALLHLRRYQDSVDTIPMSGALRTALSFAVEEAQALDHAYIGTEHLLLGISRTGNGAAQEILQASEINCDAIRQQVRQVIEQGETEIALERALRMARLSELSRRVLSRATLLAAEMQQPEPTLLHLVMALVQEKRSPAGRILQDCGLDEDQIAWDAVTGIVASSPDDLEAVLDDAVFAAERMGDHYTGTDHIVLVLGQNRHGTRLLRRYGVDTDRLQSRIRAILRSP
ncbi:MAG: hypothetical protein JXN59_17880 [Anaerolineae bacterium]|nr:hypothetical protein [Anaerolineae bacterium]